MTLLPKTTPLLVAIGSMTVLLAIACAGQKNDTRTSRVTNAKVEQNDDGVMVNGTVADEDASDFKQSGESVQVGGTNLADNVTDVIEVWRILGDGTSQKVTTVPVSNRVFSVSLKGDTYYQFVSRKSSLESVISPWMRNGGEGGQANLVMNRSSTIASKILGIVASQTRRGVNDATVVLYNNLVAPSDLVNLGASVVLATSESSRSAFDLTMLANEAVAHTLAKAKISSLDYVAFAKAVSVYQQLGLFNPAFKDIKLEVSAARTSSVNDSFDVAHQVTVSYSDKTSDMSLEAACMAIQRTYRQPSTASAADSAANTNKVKEDFQVLVNQPMAELRSMTVPKPPVVATPEPSASYTPSPTSTPSPIPTWTPTATMSSSPTASSTPLPTPSNSSSPTPSSTPLPTPSNSSSPTPSSTPLPTPSNSGSPTPSSTPLPTPSNSGSPTPSSTPLPTPSSSGSPSPSPS